MDQVFADLLLVEVPDDLLVKAFASRLVEMSDALELAEAFPWN